MATNENPDSFAKKVLTSTQEVIPNYSSYIPKFTMPKLPNPVRAVKNYVTDTAIPGVKAGANANKNIASNMLNIPEWQNLFKRSADIKPVTPTGAPQLDVALNMLKTYLDPGFGMAQGALAANTLWNFAGAPLNYALMANEEKNRMDQANKPMVPTSTVAGNPNYLSTVSYDKNKPAAYITATGQTTDKKAYEAEAKRLAELEKKAQAALTAKQVAAAKKLDPLQQAQVNNAEAASKARTSAGTQIINQNLLSGQLGTAQDIQGEDVRTTGQLQDMRNLLANLGGPVGPAQLAGLEGIYQQGAGNVSNILSQQGSNVAQQLYDLKMLGVEAGNAKAQSNITKAQMQQANLMQYLPPEVLRAMKGLS